MKTMMVNFAALSLISIMSCSQNETFKEESPVNEITFNNLNDRIPLGKAANESGSDYGIYAVLNAGNPPATTWFMENQQVDGTNNSYSPVRFWPKEGNLDFYAYAPFGSPNLDLSGMTWSSTAPQFGLTYTVPTNADEDFTIATPVAGATSGAVNLLFVHMLSKISFTTVLEQALQDDGFVLTLNYATLQVNLQEGSRSLNLPASGWTHTLPPANVIYTNGQEYMVMPQPALDISFTLNVTVTHNGSPYFTGNLATTTLPTVPNVSDFEQGTSYQFSVTVGNLVMDDKSDPVFNVILFTTDMAAWTPVAIPIP